MINVKKRRNKSILTILSYLYLFVGYSYIIYYISYYIRIANKPEGWVFMLFYALLCFGVYVVINHIFIRKIVPNKILIIIEVLLFVAMLILVISDLRYEVYRHLEYIQRTMPLTTAP